jgi:hypothetical protein
MKKNVLQRFCVCCLLGLSIVFLAACNGSGEEAVDDNNDRGLVDNPGADKVPATPVLSLALATKQLQFSWSAEAGVDHYQLMSNPDGATGFTQTGDDIPAASTATTLEIAVHRLNWPNATYLLQACNKNNQCSDSNTVSTLDSMTPAIGYIKASNPDAHDHFGISVALSADGKTLAVGSFGEDSDATGIDGDQTNNNLFGTGAVYVYIRNDSNWRQQAYIKASATQMGYGFGRVLSLSADGNTLAVGALGDSSSATGTEGEPTSDNSAMNSGAVYVYARNGDSWSQEAYVKASNTEEGDYFGSSVVLSADGNTLAVGAVGEDSNALGIEGDQTNNKAYGSGAVYVFSRENNSWAQQAYVKASNTGAGDDFGAAVALSANGNTLAVGAVGEDSAATGINGDEDDNSAEYAGAVYMFDRDANAWTQQAYVKASNSEKDDGFGSAVTLSADGDTLAVAAYGEDSADTINGDENDNGAENAGAVYVFERDKNGWTQQAYVKASNTEGRDYFGNSVALSADGNTLAVSAYLEDSDATGIDGDQADNNAYDSGAVYVFGRANNSWAQQAYVKASNTEENDIFGYSVALSADGNTLAVGAVGEGSQLIGDQTNNDAVAAGAVYLY